jgi:hypothetical protein
MHFHDRRHTHRTPQRQPVMGRPMHQGRCPQDHCAQRPPQPRHPPGRPRRAPASCDADPASHRLRPHHGDLHARLVGRTRDALGRLGEVSTAPSSCTSQLYQRQRPRPIVSDRASDLRGRYWDRTSDLFGVNGTGHVSGVQRCLTRCALTCGGALAHLTVRALFRPVSARISYHSRHHPAPHLAGRVEGPEVREQGASLARGTALASSRRTRALGGAERLRRGSSWAGGTYEPFPTWWRAGVHRYGVASPE